MEISKRFEIYFMEKGTDNNHVHILVQAVPTYGAKKKVKMIKSITEIVIYKKTSRSERTVMERKILE